MTNKERAEAYRVAAEFLEAEGYYLADVLYSKADEIETRPKAGTVIQFHTGDYGIAAREGVFCKDIGGFEKLMWDDLIVGWRLARIAGPMQEIVDIPPVKDWPGKCEDIALRWHYDDRDDINMSDYAGVSITREEAERMEAAR